MDPNVSLNYLLSRVNINDVWELALETNMFETEMLNKTLVHTENIKNISRLQNCASAFVTQRLNPWSSDCQPSLQIVLCIDFRKCLTLHLIAQKTDMEIFISPK